MSRMKMIVFMFFGLVIIMLSLVLGAHTIHPFHMSQIDREILLSVRLPRIVVALLMGMALGASGAVLQGIVKNPLADPYILGISSGAALFGSVAIISASLPFGKFTIPLAAFIGAALVSTVVGILGWKKGSIQPDRLLLAGIGLGFLLYATLMLLISISSHDGMRRAVLWVFGDLALADWSLIPYGTVLILAGLSISFVRARALNALILGDEIAHSLGFAVQRERLLLFIAISLMTSASVSLGGTVGFIGLLIPHMVRFMGAADNRYLVPLSALYGGVFLCAADTIGRSLLPPMEIPSGIVTALIGAPYFLYLLRRQDILTG